MQNEPNDDNTFNEYFCEDIFRDYRVGTNMLMMMRGSNCFVKVGKVP